MTSSLSAAPDTTAVVLRELHLGDDFTAFRTLNEEWISRYFVLENKDREQLNHPEQLLHAGAHIYLALLDGRGIGCVALVLGGNGVFELSKMAVAPESRGLGIGRRLLEHAIGEARRLGAASLFLGSNTVLSSAVRLYEAAGFQHFPLNGFRTSATAAPTSSWSSSSTLPVRPPQPPLPRPEPTDA